MFGFQKKVQMPVRDDAIQGRADAVEIADTHLVTGNAMRGPFPDNLETAVFGMGCFWGVERLFWQQPGVYTSAVGYIGGYTQNPTYNEVCTGNTGHNEVVQVVFDPVIISYGRLLEIFWEAHDPTQGMRQGNDMGTQYRSGIYALSTDQRAEAMSSRDNYQKALTEKDLGTITTEIVDAAEFYYAEDYHQQYLAKNPDGYCNLRGTGVACA